MSKRFIAYFLGFVLATVAFVSTAQAQIEEYHPIEPCDVILGDTIHWDQPSVYMEILPCGCRVFCEYYYAHHHGSHYVHISQYWVSLARPNCDHNLSDWTNWGRRDLSEIGLHNYLEIKILEKMGRAGTDIDGVQIFTSKAKCKSRWWVEKPVIIEFPGPIEFDPADQELIDFDLKLPKIPIDIHWRPCTGEKCCVSLVNAKFEDGFSQSTGHISTAQKFPIEVFEYDPKCTGGIFFPCTYDCGDQHYYFDKNIVRPKTLVDDNFDQGMAMAPNPSDGSFTLSISDKYDSVEITIADMLGNIVLKTTQNTTSKDYTLSNLNSGMYVVTMTVNNEIVGKKMFSIVK